MACTTMRRDPDQNAGPLSHARQHCGLRGRGAWNGGRRGRGAWNGGQDRTSGTVSRGPADGTACTVRDTEDLGSHDSRAT